MAVARQRFVPYQLLLGALVLAGCLADPGDDEHDHAVRKTVVEPGLKVLELLDRDDHDEVVATAYVVDDPLAFTMAIRYVDGPVLQWSFDRPTESTSVVHTAEDGSSVQWVAGSPPTDELASWERTGRHWNNQFREPEYADWVNRTYEDPAEAEDDDVSFRGGCPHGTTYSSCASNCEKKRLGACHKDCIDISSPGGYAICVVACNITIPLSCQNSCKDCPVPPPSPPAPPPPPPCWQTGCVPSGGGGDGGSDENCANGCCYGDGC